MAFDLDGQALGYGSGTENFTPAAGNHTINAYARVTNITKKTITIADATDATKFTAGTEVLLQIVNVNSTSYRSKLGGWRVCKITAVSGNVLTVTNSPSTLIKASLPNTTTQIITVPTYKNFTINEGVNIKPTPYSDGRGGVVAFKCSGTLTFNGGHIDLTGAGLSSARTLLKQEANQTTPDSQYKHSCWENYATQKHFTLQQGDGAAFIICKKLVGNANSRIGNPAAQGVHYQRGKHDNSWKNSPVGNLSGFTFTGGSSILICAGSHSGLSVKMFAKYRTGTDDTETRGFGRCYIASNSTLRLDEACYAADVISTPSRLQDTFNIKDFGDGSDGIPADPTAQFNNYARITAISEDRCTVNYASRTTAGFAAWKTGALVMIHAMHKGDNVKYSGRFHIARIIGIKGSRITLDAPIPSVSSFDTNYYHFQIITIPQFESFTLNAENDKTSAYNDDKLRGGIFAIAVNGTCDLSGGKINVMGKGGGSAYGLPGLGYISNQGMATRLPIGQGHGSVFILAKHLIMNSDTRIGATYSGANYGGSTPFSAGGNPQYGYIGSQPGDAASNDKIASSDSTLGLDGTRGFGGKGGTNDENHNGGTGSNATGAKASKAGGRQGAHVMIVADKITGFNMAAISTGGESAYKWAGKYARTKNCNYVFHGGASYGGAGIHSEVEKRTVGGKQIDVFALNGSGGFVNGGAGSGNKSEFGLGGGSSGFAFVYCNDVDSQSTTDILVD